MTEKEENRMPDLPINVIDKAFDKAINKGLEVIGLAPPPTPSVADEINNDDIWDAVVSGLSGVTAKMVRLIPLSPVASGC
jgi:hypothetical protein